ncbi:MAG: ATP-binding cassette domain-containing protein [Candidatus Brocadiae bacterium]|nr:ATP-binding cassette domain-containing protein [Candidatus Brocadiia bacterium]
MKKAAVMLKEVEKSFFNRRTKKIVLNRISFCAFQGEVTVLMGQSGCGKSTLFRILIGEEVPDSGSISILEQDVSPPHYKNIENAKKQFGILFQYGALFNSMNVGDNIAFPILEHQPQLHENIVNIMVETKLNQVEMQPEIYKEKMPSTLSGGERKRVALARALALDPKLIFCDEPSAGLDPIVSRTIDKLIQDLVRVLGIAALVVTHELDSAFSIADRMILLKRAVPEHQDKWEGAIVYEEGSPEELRNSKKPYTVEFLGEYSYYSLCPFCKAVQKKGYSTCYQCQKTRSGTGINC